jgi:hypothetical protein
VFYRDLAGAVEAGKHKHPPRSIIRTLRPFAKRYGPEVLRYYLMHEGNLQCDQSLKVYERLRESPQ